MLDVIGKVNKTLPVDLISTCLAAHIKPKDFDGSPLDYLKSIIKELLPEIKKRSLSNRIDIYIDHGAFTVDEARFYLKEAKMMGFDLVIHGDQFTAGGSLLACELEALSVDHLEAITESDIKLLSASNVIPVALPGASLGLGCKFAPARKLLDAGCSLAIGSDWNPGSAPMGDLLRFTGRLELSNLDTTPNPKHIAGIERALREYIQLDEKLAIKETWAGLRPTTPDGMPIIGISPSHKNLILATGHAMLGLSLGPGTGQIVSELANGKAPAFDIHPLRLERFQ